MERKALTQPAAIPLGMGKGHTLREPREAAFPGRGCAKKARGESAVGRPRAKQRVSGAGFT